MLVYIFISRRSQYKQFYMRLTQPVSLSERSSILDVLRGIALLGICVANYPVLSFFVFQPESVKAQLPGNAFDHHIEVFHDMFIEGKFYSMFSLLFGIGFSIFLERGKKEGKSVTGTRIFLRRLFILMIFGLMHLLLLWEGDILMLYAVLGFLLPFFRNRSDRTLLICWLILIFSPLLFDLVKVLSSGRLNLSNAVYDAGEAVANGYGITQQNFFQWMPTHSEYVDVLKYNHSSFYFRWGYLLDGNRLPKVLGMFLLGLYAGRNAIYRRLEENLLLLIRVRNYGYLIGIPASVLMVVFRNDAWRLPQAGGLLDTLAYALSVVPLSLAYTATVCIWYRNERSRRRLNIFIAPGRMALTNYIAQTLLAVMIFYGIGFGWGAKVSLATSVAISFAVYIFLLAISHIWLQYFNYGPLEWIWRQLTYGKRLPLVKQRNRA